MLQNRRSFLTSFAGVSLATHPALAGEQAETAPATFDTHQLHFDRDERWAKTVNVYVPRHLDPTRSWPVAVLLHGYAQGETISRAVNAWDHEYGVLEAYDALRSPAPVTENPVLDSSRAEEINSWLGAHPFQGFVLICPVVPIPYYMSDPSATYVAYQQFLCGEVMERVDTLTPFGIDRNAVGLAGFSMGGMVGLELLWRFPQQFKTYAGIQAAISRKQAFRYAWLVKRAITHQASEEPPSIQLVTARHDRSRWANRALYEALKRKECDAKFELRPGKHTSRWMRSAGSTEALLWLDQALHRQAAAPTLDDTLQDPTRAADEAVS